MLARSQAAVAFLFLCFGAIALADPAGIKQTARVEGITEYELENGLKLLLFPDDSKPTVTVNITYLVGSRHEGYGEGGMAHLLEHMLFKGTPTHGNIPALMKERGAVINGTTSFDRTNYYETLPSSDDNLEFALRLEADRMINSHVAAADLATEMTVVRNEFERSENSIQRVLMQRMMAAAFDWHNYGKTTIGNRADIERVPIDNLRDFYRRYYRPDNCLLIIAGKFDREKALGLVAKYFLPLERPQTKLNKTYTEEPAQDGERFVMLRRVGTVPSVGLVYHVPAGGHEEFVPVQVLEGVLTAEVSGRLYKSLVATKKAATVSGTVFSLHDPGMMLIVAQAAPEVTPDALRLAMLESIDQVITGGVTAEEVERIRSTVLKQRELREADTAQLAISLSNWASQGDWRLYFMHRDRMEAVTSEQVSLAATKYLKADNRTVGVFEPTASPDRTLVPQLADLESTARSYKGREETAEGEQFDVAPLAIEKRTHRVKLRSGVQGALIEKKTRGNTVTMRLTLRYGNLDSLKGVHADGDFLPDMLLRGTKAMSRQQFDDALDKLRGQVSVRGGTGVVEVTIRARRNTLPGVLQLVRQALREPAFDAKEFDLLKQEQLTSLKQNLTDPGALAARALSRHLTPYAADDPRYVPTIAEEIEQVEKLGVEQVRKLYDRFLSGQNGEVTIVGDFDSSEVIPSVESLLDGWISKEKFVRIPRGAAKVAAGKSEILTPDKKNAVYEAGLVNPLRDDHPDYPALVVGNFILGGGALASRLGDRIRQKEGLSYSIRSQVAVSSLDENMTFQVSAISNPANITKVQQAVIEEIEKLLKDGISDDELAKAKLGWLQVQQVNRGNDANLAQVLGTNLVASRTFEHQAKLEAKIGELTREQVVETLRKYLHVKNLFVSTAGDFSTK